MAGAALLLGGVALLIDASERLKRRDAYAAARAAARWHGKPLLNVGCPASRPLSYPCGDVCLDLDPARLTVCRAAEPRVGDVRDIPYPDEYFGAAFCSHVLEHLATVADAERALAELHRVADVVIVVSPSRWSPFAILFPEHQLWPVHHEDGSITFDQRCRGTACGEWYYPLLTEVWDTVDSTLRSATTGLPATSFSRLATNGGTAA